MTNLGDKLTFCVAMCIVGVVFFTIGWCMVQCYVSPTDLKFQLCEVVAVKAGGQGQIVDYWNISLEKGLGMTPLHRYKLRLRTSKGTTYEWFKGYELAKLHDDTWTWPKPPLKNDES